MDSNIYDIDEGIAEELSGAMAGDQIVLPFPALYVWWINGDQKLKPRSADPTLADIVPWTGGWASTTPEDFESVCSEIYGDLLPGWEQTVLINTNGENFGAYVTRYLSIAIIGQRERWEKVERDNADSRQRSHTQILGYAGFRDKEKGFLPFGPMVMSAKGLSGKALKDALQEWNRQTAKLRKESAKNLPAWLFYATLGTFGNEPNLRMVGKGSNQSPITPCQIYIAKELDADKLAKVFVGREIALLMSEYRKQAAEWLNAWKTQDADVGAPEIPDAFPQPAAGAPQPPADNSKAKRGKAATQPAADPY